ncbi:hypothetical protein SAMN04488002_2788 [Litoreibacter janthinus]|uniref:Uncharacterized protein n=1 Tax=Litoreibacter janthinus TaxID=670154 RepID=A0A1I6HBX3_9RHOB|nr:hypothetical protein SAMN04488002_2788 [Litoreibacter janthinus]
MKSREISLPKWGSGPASLGVAPTGRPFPLWGEAARCLAYCGAELAIHALGDREALKPLGYLPEITTRLPSQPGRRPSPALVMQAVPKAGCRATAPERLLEGLQVLKAAATHCSAAEKVKPSQRPFQIDEAHPRPSLCRCPKAFPNSSHEKRRSFRKLRLHSCVFRRARSPDIRPAARHFPALLRQSHQRPQSPYPRSPHGRPASTRLRRFAQR